MNYKWKNYQESQQSASNQQIFRLTTNQVCLHVESTKLGPCSKSSGTASDQSRFGMLFQAKNFQHELIKWLMEWSWF